MKHIFALLTRIPKILFLSLNKLRPYFISHHPICTPYNDHVITIKNIKICKGCISTVYPFFGFFILLLVLEMLHISIPKVQDIEILFYGMVLATIIILILKSVSKHSIIIIISSIIFVINSYILYQLLQNNQLDIVLGTYIVISVYLIVNLKLRFRNMNKICINCSQYPNYGKCDGLYPFYKLNNEIDIILQSS